MQVYKAIKYIRLSYTDDKTVESDSVANQRRLIDDYIARHPEIEVVAEKIDEDKLKQMQKELDTFEIMDYIRSLL